MVFRHYLIGTGPPPLFGLISASRTRCENRTATAVATAPPAAPPRMYRAMSVMVCFQWSVLSAQSTRFALVGIVFLAPPRRRTWNASGPASGSSRMRHASSQRTMRVMGLASASSRQLNRLRTVTPKMAHPACSSHRQ